MSEKQNILAINTTTRECSVALLSNEQCHVATEYTERGHDGIVLGLVDEVLKLSGHARQDIELLAFGRGPGAFTGIRVATAVTQGLAVGLGLKVVPVSDLLNVAYQHYKQTGHQCVASCFDARMGEIYAAIWQFDEFSVQNVQKEQLLEPQNWNYSADSQSEKLVGAGNGFSEFPDLAVQLALNASESDYTLFPTAAATAELAQLLLKTGFTPVDAIDALPVYLRNDVAHRKQ